MSEQFYLLTDDKEIPQRWYLRGPTTPEGMKVDAREFIRGRSVELDRTLRIACRRPGEPLDFTLGDFDMPVLKNEYAAGLKRLASQEVQVLPVLIEGIGEGYSIINITTALRCLDEGRSQVTYWPSDDPRSIDRYRMVISPVIDREVAAGHHLFRIAGWETALVVSASVSAILEHARGAALEPCT